MTYGEKMAKTEAVECFSLYDISAIVYTKSAHRIILPMIAELYNLIIAIEQREITHEAFANLETTAEELAKATEELGCIAKRLAEKSGDEVLEKEMVSATQTLLVSGKNILLAVQKLLIQPDVCSSVEELAVSAKRILVGTIKITRPRCGSGCSINWCMVKMTSLQAKEEYSKRTKELIEFACNVQKGLDECNQPDILSPLRDDVHDFNISIDVPKALASQDPMEFSTHNFIKQNSSNNAELLVGSLDKFKPPYCPSLEFPRRNIIYRKDAVRTIDLHPLIRELTTATSIHDAICLNGICADLLELANCCIDAAKEALRIVESPMSDKLLHYKEIVGLIPLVLLRLKLKIG